MRGPISSSFSRLWLMGWEGTISLTFCVILLWITRPWSTVPQLNYAGTYIHLSNMHAASGTCSNQSCLPLSYDVLAEAQQEHSAGPLWWPWLSNYHCHDRVGQGFNIHSLLDSILLRVPSTTDLMEQESGQAGHNLSQVAQGIVLYQLKARINAIKYMNG